MKKLFLFLSLAFLLSACAEKHDWELTYKTSFTKTTPVSSFTTTNVSKSILLDYTEKAVIEHIKGTTGSTVEWVGNTKYITKTTCTYKEL